RHRPARHPHAGARAHRKICRAAAAGGRDGRCPACRMNADVEPRMLYRGMDRGALDAAYNNSAAVPARSAIYADWNARSAALRSTQRCQLDLAYGVSPRERLDLFLAPEAGAPTLVFIHGGYWQMNDKESFSFLAEGPLRRGINAVIVEYTLAP